MSKPNWTHTISPSVGDSRVVNPSGDWELAIKGAWEDLPYCRDYRLKIEGEMIFTGDDYLWLIGQECYTQLDYEIKCNGAVIWEGYFSYPQDFEIDEDTCSLVGAPYPNDKYTKFDDTADEAHQLEDQDDVIAWETMPPGTDAWTCHDHASIVETITHELLEDTIGVAAAIGQPISTFYWNDIRPDGVNIGTHNYVTGNDPNELNLFGFIMTDEVANDTNPDYPEISWNDWMSVLHDFYNVWWYIDDQDDKVRIEHIRWWEGYWFGGGDDLTVLDSGIWIENKNKYSFQNQQVPIIEEWDMENEAQNGNDFVDGNNIRYPSVSYHPRRGAYFIKTYPIPDVSTDIEYASTLAITLRGYMFLHLLDYTAYLWTDPGNTAPDGIARPNLTTACSGAPPDWVVWYEAGAVTAANHSNAHMALTNIIEAYWYRWRPQLTGTTWAGVVNFTTQEPLYLQRDLAYPKCCDNGDNEYQFQIVTQYGNGYIRAGSLTQDGMLTKLELLHAIVCT